jgi:hypothetical protein
MDFIIENYSEKSFVVCGEKTIKFKSRLKELGGKYNPNLKCGAGWIFSIKHKENVLRALEEMEEYMYLVLKGRIIRGIYSKEPIFEDCEIKKIPINKSIDLLI